ncbi:MAG: LSU ribosomal protein L9p [uncultured Thermomicrobiales bacterium]|uniref:Large ribosomal subunit protein bL9 n=1 Tax=uncultured Thermomicrobiales bacterium TaxID=1645740 RepID=A0A6J4UHK8_9BACT|nr:MAG: LSU ribosomal protein L9p [uncultured Thermomicrobiales bacterium]
MKIVMRQDVEKVGDKGSVQTVSDGYARNYLIPKGFAVVATPGELKTVEQYQKVQARKLAKQEAEQQALADKIDGKQLSFTARASDQGRLFGSVTAGDIATDLSALVGETIDRRRVVLDEAIRNVGVHSVTIHLVGRLRPKITVTVEAEATEETDSRAAAAPATAEATVDATPAETTEA